MISDLEQSATKSSATRDGMDELIEELDLNPSREINDQDCNVYGVLNNPPQFIGSSRIVRGDFGNRRPSTIQEASSANLEETE